MEYIILVDEHDNQVGSKEKLLVHERGLLHRAFSIFVFNPRGEVLLQRRALKKYHSAGLWSNTCCGHPRAEEVLEDAAHRRLQEEMGFDCSLKEKFAFLYKVDFENGLIENEWDHVFVGKYDGKVLPNKEEVLDSKWCTWDFLVKDVASNPESYSHWFKEIIKRGKLYVD